MKKILTSRFDWLFVTMLIIAVNWVASRYHYRADLTAEKRYTLGEPTKKLLGNLDDEIDIDVFLTGNLKSGIRNLSQKTEELLSEFREYGKGRIEFRFFDPLTELDDSAKANFLDSLGRMGIERMTQVAQSKKGDEQSQRIVLPGAIVKYKGRVFPVNLLKGVRNPDENSLYNNAEAQLEYKFASAIDKITQKEIPSVAYVLGNGEPLDFRVYDLIEDMRKNYALHILRLDSFPYIPPTFKTIVIVRPTRKFSESDKLKLDQYVMRGGNVIWFVDNLLAEMDSLRMDRSTVAYDRGLNLEDFFFRAGARINLDLVQDMQCASINFVVGMQGDKPQMQLLPWPYYPLLDGSLFHPISKNLDPVYGKFANSLDTVKANGIQKTVLLQTSVNGRSISTPALISFESVKVANDPAVFNRPNIPVAVLLEGKFNSLFANRISSTLADTLATLYKQPFLPSGQRDAKMIICADAGVATNEVTQNGPIALGMNKDINYSFANQDFIGNCLEYMVNPSGILEARSKDFTLRMLDPKKTEEDRGFWQLVNVALPISLILLSGLIYQALRTRKYGRA